MDAPTFQLPACPACSSILALERPMWKLARRTTAARRVQCWGLVGCSHAAEVSKPGTIYDDLELVELVESAWAARVVDLFAAKTARWPAHAAEAFGRALADRPGFKGLTIPLCFPPAPPAQQEPNDKTK